MDESSPLLIGDFLALTVGILVYFVGVLATRRFAVLREFNIPEPVTGGLLAALTTLGVHALFDLSISFELATRDRLLIYFFTAIGLNARLSDLVKGGRALLILLVLTLGYIVVQDVIGVIGTVLFGLPQALGVLTGSASLIGGHGTAIAWAPEIARLHGIDNAPEIGIASATFGLILASLIGGPIAKLLITRHNLTTETSDAAPMVGLPYAEEDRSAINHLTLMSALLALHLAIILGYIVNEALQEAGIMLPLFVTCLLMAIVMSNLLPRLMPRLPWPARTRSLAVISDYSLNIFLAMSLMSMQLWTLAGLAGPLLGILALQTLAAFLFIVFVLFPLMGANYEAAVLGAGFGGFALGATPTAIANMTAVTKKHGPAPNAFIILPLVAAFFVDIANAFVIGYFVT
ncbi:MAG: sodium/glutamate symporter [Rhodospirillales bacterium]|nr:MAG: sodium/glutamate symporter [Rhodospirillales bacterium]